MHRIDHRQPSFVVVFEFRRAPGLEFLRLAVELRDASLVHQAHPNVALRIKSQVESACRRSGLRHRHGVLDNFGGLGIELAEILRAEIRIPDHALGIDRSVVRHGLRTW